MPAREPAYRRAHVLWKGLVTQKVRRPADDETLGGLHIYAWITSTRTSAPGESQLAQDWFCPYCTGPYFQ